MRKFKIILSFLFFIFACQPIEQINKIVFDNNQFANFNILSSSVEIDEIFEKKISEPFIGYTLPIDPSQRIVNWVNSNFKPIGNENIFIVSILDASITQIEFENKLAKNFDEKNNYKYELFYLLEFNLFDDSKNLIASTLVEISRSTTSGMYISIQEKEKIIDDLIYQGLADVSMETKKQLTSYMENYII